jgi:hypothetical protein
MSERMVFAIPRESHSAAISGLMLTKGSTTTGASSLGTVESGWAQTATVVQKQSRSVFDAT